MNTFESMIADAETRNTYWEERAIIEFTAEACRLMEEQEMSRADLARQLEKSQPWVTKLLGGRNNFTLQTMVRVARALQGKLCVHIQPEGAQTVWYELWQKNQIGQVTDDGQSQVAAYSSLAAEFSKPVTGGKGNASVLSAA